MKNKNLNKKICSGGHSLLNNGFTLIELLAVIIILAIIALIATPIILNIIESSKESAIISGGRNYLRAVEQSILEKNLKTIFDPKECIIQSDGNLICDEIELEVPTTGTRPIEGTLKITNKIPSEVIDMVLDDYILEMRPNEELHIKGKYDTSALSAPDLSMGLTPVTYDGNNWKVASTSSKWYNYDKQEWANAVILKNDVTKNVGDTVNVETEILGMFVWIPRYEYKIEGTYGTHSDGTVGTQALPGEIKVNFTNKKEASEGYIIHPAFTFGSKILNGIWVGKFETTGNATNPTVLPNNKSLVNQNVSTQFKTAQVFNTYLTNADAHMVRNDEWGAVAYLSQSKYGKYGNTEYIGADKEVYINNSSYIYTGRSGGNVGGSTPINGTYTDQTSTTTYNSSGFYTYDGYLIEYGTNNKTTREIKKGTGASTTGNIYGVYDMVGGAYDRVMGVLADSNGNPRSGYNTSSNSGYKGILYDGTTEVEKTEGEDIPESKYYNLYTSTTSTKACNNGICYGQALSETAGWYKDYTTFVSTSYPWFNRGGNYNSTSNTGVFSFYRSNGSSSSSYSFRVVLPGN